MRNGLQRVRLEARKPIAMVHGGDHRNEEEKLDLQDVQRKSLLATNFHYSYSTHLHKAFDPNQQDSVTNRMPVCMLRTGGRGEQLRKERIQKLRRF